MSILVKVIPLCHCSYYIHNKDAVMLDGRKYFLKIQRADDKPGDET
jgi:hypothetical protein